MDSQLTTTAPGYRWKDLLLGPPLATSRLVRERLRKLVALFAALNRLASVNVAVVHPPPTTPTADEFPASRYARRQLVLRS
jgi:hypothetical protein